MYLKSIAVLVGAVCASAQTKCPPLNFLNAKTINLAATELSHLVVLRQSDGSYTAFEMANAAPYRVLRTIPHFEQQFSSCLSRPSGVRAAFLASNSLGGAAQPAAFAVLSSGNHLFVSANRSESLDVAVFDPRLQLISENQVAAFPPDQPSPGSNGVYLSLILTDVNSDGKLDVVAQYEFVHGGDTFGNGGGIRVLLGDGNGSFHLVDDFPLGNVNGSMAAGDLNGDGKPDLVIGAPQDPAQQASALIIALGKGDGTFAPSSLSTPNQVGPAALVIADLNRDGKNDIVSLTSALSPGSPYPPNEVAVMLGSGDGTFSPPAVFPVQATSPDSVLDDRGTPGALAAGDLNGDGNLDIVTNGITILLGDGKGGFPNRKDFLNTAQESVILTDFDGDGKPDVVIGNGNSAVLSGAPPFSDFQENSLSVFFGDGMGSLAAPPVGPSPVQTSFSFSPAYTLERVPLASADFNQDGSADLASVTAFQYLSVFVTSASGNLTHVSTYDFAAIDKDASPTSVVVADFNGDGIIDLAVSVARSSSPGSIEVFLGVGDGTFLPPVASSAPPFISSLVVGDFNKDGRPDLAAIGAAGSSNGYQVAIFLSQGDGTFAPTQSYPFAALPSSLAVGDFNRDGMADIAVGNSNSIQILPGKGDGTFSQGASIAFPDGVPGRLAAADLNGDGKLDLVAGAAILLGHGDGTFASPAIYSSGAAPGFGGDSVAIGDFNGDGILDVCLSTSTFLIGNGDGTFQLQTTDLPGGSAIAADFNGDGKLDIASGFIVPEDPVALRAGAAVFFNLSHSTALMSVVSAANFSYGPMAPHSIASAFGKHLALTTAPATPPSLPTTLGGTSVSVQDQSGAISQAEIYFASPGQVNFVLPQGLEAGTALVTITTTDGQSATTEIQIADPAPKLFTADPSGIPAGYAVRVGPDNVQTIEPIFTGSSGHIQQVPIDLSQGEVYLVLFGTGFDAPNNPQLEIGTSSVTPSYVGPQSQYPGLDQLNILLPKSLAGSGVTDVNFSGANIVYITIK